MQASCNWPGDSQGPPVPSALPASDRYAWATTRTPALIGDTTAVPPGALAPALTPELAAVCERAAASLARLDAISRRSPHLAPLMACSESLASSRIEGVTPTVPQFLAAAHRDRAPSESSPTDAEQAATDLAATAELLSGSFAEPGTPPDLEELLASHRRLMAIEPMMSEHAGVVREQHVWIGGWTPETAVYVAPAPEELPRLLADLVAFCARTDLPGIAHAALAHAQFESIHPFADGNGRTGRALLAAMLRRAGLTTEVVACVSVGILARRRDYYAALTAYRGGGEGIGRIIELVADTADQAGRAGIDLAGVMLGMIERWEARLSGVRGGSASAELLRILRGSPGKPPPLTVDAAWLTGRTGRSTSSVYEALSRLVEAGALTEVSESPRSRVFSPVGVVMALEVLTATP